MSKKDFTTILKQFGFVFIRSGKGSHEVWSNGAMNVIVTYHSINRMIARRELKRIGYTDYKRI